jgi:hypothetical protein
MEPLIAFSGSAFEPAFAQPAPPVLDPHAKRILFPTQYFVPSMDAVTSGEPLLDDHGSPLGSKPGFAA